MCKAKSQRASHLTGDGVLVAFVEQGVNRKICLVALLCHKPASTFAPRQKIAGHAFLRKEIGAFQLIEKGITPGFFDALTKVMVNEIAWFEEAAHIPDKP